MIVIVLPISIALAAAIVLAQGSNDLLGQLRACSAMERADRLECLDRLSHAAAPPAISAPEDGWIVSQTTSPLDYTPIATATISSREAAAGSTMQLSIRCRGGRTELAVAGPALPGRGDGYVLSYRVNGGPPVQLAGNAPAFGGGIAFAGDVVGLLRSLPGEGELDIRLQPRMGATREGTFSLTGLEKVRAKIEAVCKWPHAVARPNDR
ncbi:MULTISPECIES: hypothetical protein [unclassified Bradyrhizobium]|uniref:hypothetical protein n=1 Tax=unclassified Bradyrhizobium TaxID=2631580 RepID=UPI002479A6AA|nr:MULTISPECIES: hypothetical protein [unclassified Bradyrhizobium]WGS21015.1 hypothetical protein MTX22_04320 [Bradyrhizobium sp. ISRA463]WGS27927.1 hypothetical protein MTX19_02170 [Bradyrhizobium sp. ISRA464]